MWIYFLEVFKTVIQFIFINITQILERTDISFEEKINLIVDSYFTLLSKHPKLPLFVLSELGNLPEFATKTEFGNRLNNASVLFESNMKSFKKVVPGDGFQLLLSLVSLCAFPFMASTVLRKVRPQDGQSFEEFMKYRKSYVKNVLKKSYL